VIFADFETRSVIDVTELGATRYAMDPSTQVLCLCWSFDDDADVFLWHRAHQEDGKEPWCQKTRRPDELIERIRSGETFEAHNAGFEFAIWNEVLTREFPEFDVKLKLEQMRCSAAKASCLSLPRALGDALKAAGAPTEFHKMADGRRLINKLSKPRYRILHMDEEKWLTWVRFEISDLYDEGDDFDLETMYSMTGALSKSQRGSIRQMTQRFFLEPGHAETLMPGVYRWTDNPPPPAERDIERPAPAERIAYFDESEEDHRKNWEYCAQDVRGERWLSKWCPEMTERELDYWRMDQRMNIRGVKLDVAGVEAANELVKQEVKRLNAEMVQITEGAVQGGGKRVAWRNWANKQLTDLSGGYLANTKADTLSFALYGVPIKAGDQAREAAKPAQDEKWGMWGDAALPLRRSMEICLEVNKPSVSKFKRMTQAVCPDGRVHDIMLYNGADRTGRWAGKGIQPHNFVRGYMVEMPEIWGELLSVETDFEFLEAITGGDKALHVLAKACRGALVASDGYELYAADFNAIEARKLAWLSGCVAMLNSFAPGATTDLYCQMASAIYRREITKKDKSERNLGKKAILGLGYAMGWEKFQSTVWMDEGIWLPDEFCQGVVKIYRKEMYPEVPALWKASNDAAINAVVEGGEWSCGGDEMGIGSVQYFVEGRFLHCRLPSGRLLAYLDPEVHHRITWTFKAKNERGTPTVVRFPAKPGVAFNRVRYHAEKLAEKQRKTLTNDPPENFSQPHLSFMGRNIVTKKWQRCGAHGGVLVENYDQASSRDLLAEAMYRVDQRDPFRLLLSIHDEVIAEAPIGTCKVKEFEDIMAEGPKWAPGMPIAAEGWIGPRLRK